MIIDSGIGTGSLQVSGSFSVLGTTRLNGTTTVVSNLIVSGGITGSFQGTSSFAASASVATSAATASFITASNVWGPFGSGSVTSASFSVSSSIATSSSFALTASSVNVLNQGVVISGSLTVFTGSGVELRITNTGVNIGNIISDRHNITGSVNISGSLLVNGSPAGTGAGGATVTISGSIPSGSNPSGSLWWNENDGNLYIQVTSPTGSTYVPATNTVAGGNYGATFREGYTGSTWTVNHNLNTTTPLVNVYSGSSVMIPASIVSTNANTTTIVFSGSVQGTAVVSTGIGGPTSSSFALSSVSSSYAVTASLAARVVTSPTIIRGTAGAVVKPTTTTYDYITLTDDNTGWCTVDMALRYTNASGAGGAGANSVKIFTLPGGYQFDTAVHITTTAANMITSENGFTYSGMDSMLAPTMNGWVTNTAGAFANLVVVPFNATEFRLGITTIFGGTITAWDYYGGVFAIGDPQSLKCSFRFKKA